MESNDDVLIDALSELLPRGQWQRGRGGKCSHADDSMTGRTLHKLYHSGDGLTPGELRDMLNVTGARVTAILKELENKGLLRRGPGAKDRRSVLVTLTDEGRRAVESYIARRRMRAARVVERLGAEDAETLSRLLRIVRELDAENGKTP